MLLADFTSMEAAGEAVRSVTAAGILPAGMEIMEAARDINFSDYDSWGDGERIAVNVASPYREFSGDTSEPDVVALFGLMAQLHKDRHA